MTEPDSLLSSLCSIWCKILTCSLPCVKRHKLWAQCSGVRDPAAYIKHSNLVTPAGIDHDYNYLTSIEREFDKAEREASVRGIILDEPSDQKRSGPAKGEVPLNATLERSEIIVAKAPKGMHRSKTNRTKWVKQHKCLEWTVEWVHPDGRKELVQCLDNTPLYQCYQAIVNPKPRERKTKKRKTMTEHEDSPSKGQCAADGDRSGATDVKDQREDSAPRSECLKDNLPSSPTTNNQTSPVSPPNPDPNISFHLHTPTLPSRQTIVALLEPEFFLSSGLRTRLVLEYPTIYVLNQASNAPLPEGFLSERQFFENARKEMLAEVDEGEIVEEAGGNEGEETNGTSNGTQDATARIEKLDEKKLLEVLGKDMKAR
ncbi:uncharacterized protein KY384_007868 [Bacidia gigantensis]|uniref:uncharacterized protein n=1 Tax=Bacidia gigantensis TaxID=2732470 RepID=UPI001D038895|nr:uncharacterized protein KY384_007868 [Bacidia gigantensis]KAG8527714.1 hypothetical protein KY384_007868 [Bacidia gigantensis]